MSTLIRPDNLQPAEFVAARPGYICLRTSCITPAVRWYSVAAIESVNPVATCALPPSHIAAAQLQQDIERARELWRMIRVADEPTTAPIVFLTTEHFASVNDSIGVTLVPFDETELAA